MHTHEISDLPDQSEQGFAERWPVPAAQRGPCDTRGNGRRTTLDLRALRPHHYWTLLCLRCRCRVHPGRDAPKRASGPSAMAAHYAKICTYSANVLVVEVPIDTASTANYAFRLKPASDAACRGMYAASSSGREDISVGGTCWLCRRP
jgi:hypothetical protein